MGAEIRPGQVTARHIRVYLDGVDVTDICTGVQIPDGMGWADLALKDGADRFVFEGDAIATERKYGWLRFKENPKGVE